MTAMMKLARLKKGTRLDASNFNGPLELVTSVAALNPIMIRTIRNGGFSKKIMRVGPCYNEQFVRSR
jgi:hypothetical protein